MMAEWISKQTSIMTYLCMYVYIPMQLSFCMYCTATLLPLPHAPPSSLFTGHDLVELSCTGLGVKKKGVLLVN